MYGVIRLSCQEGRRLAFSSLGVGVVTRSVGGSGVFEARFDDWDLFEDSASLEGERRFVPLGR